MNSRNFEELLPLVAELSNKYTSGESTSVTYEKAEQLMGAVVYTIGELKQAGKGANRITGQCSIKEQYVIGRDLLIQKVKETKECYDQMLESFDSYGNINYYETVVNAISGFFLYYDAQFEPQNSVITCDYPTVRFIFQSDDTGIDRIARYLDDIVLEQKFLSPLSRADVIEILRQYDENYETQYYNISIIIVRHILGCMAVGKDMLSPATDTDYERLFTLIGEKTEPELGELWRDVLRKFLDHYYDESEELYHYFVCDIEDFVTQIKTVKEAVYIKNVVVL